MGLAFEQRVGVFVDVQNMFYAAKHLYNSKLNFARLLDTIGRDRPLTRAIAYVVQTPEIDQSNFLAMLRSNGYEIRAKDLKQRPDGSAKGDWDMGLALDALAMSDRLDVVAIVSGDGDFVELVNYLKARGVRVEVYSFPYSTAEELRHCATEYFQMGTEMVMNPQSRPPAGFAPRDGFAQRDGLALRDGYAPRENNGRDGAGARDGTPLQGGYAARENYNRDGYAARDAYAARDGFNREYATSDYHGERYAGGSEVGAQDGDVENQEAARKSVTN